MAEKKVKQEDSFLNDGDEDDIMNNSNSLSNSSDEDDSEGQNDYERDGFVVDSEEEEEMGESKKEKRRKKKKKKKVKREILDEDDELDEDDLDLIQENKQQTHKKRLKKVAKEKEILQQQQQQQLDEDFMDEESDLEERGHAQALQKLRKKQSYMDDEEDDQDLMSVEEDIGYEDLKQQLFDPDELTENYQTEKDQFIVDQDQPERLQLRYNNREAPKGQELDYETRWIYEKIQEQQKIPENQEPIYLKKIRKVLEFLRVEYYEVMYIYYYKKNEILPQLELNDLWTIYDLDNEWAQFSILKDQLLQDYKRLQISDVVDENILTNLEKSDTILQLNHLKQYLDYRNFLKEISQEENRVVRKKGLGKNLRLIQQLRISAIHEISELVSLTPDELAENLMKKNRRLRNNPKPVEVDPSNVSQQYQKQNDPLLSTPLAVLQSISKYTSIDLSFNPLIKTWTLLKYKNCILISTEPTEKGKKEIDILNQFYTVKRITRCKLDEFTKNYSYLLLQKAEQLQLINVKFQFNWEAQMKKGEVYAQVQQNYDTIYKELVQNYTADTDASNPSNLEGKWNVVRTEIIKILLNDILYPFCKKQVVKELKEQAEKQVIDDCAEKFYDQLVTAPWQGQKDAHDETMQNNKDKDEDEGEKIMSIVVTNDNKLACAIVDSFGAVLDTIILKNYCKRDNPLAVKEKQILENDYIKKRRPDLICVTANSIQARNIKRQMLSYSEKNYTQWVTFTDDTIPIMRARKDPSTIYPEEIKIAISLARIMQNPISEVLNLWSDNTRKNGCLFIQYHPLQNEVNIEKLKQEYEKKAVQVVNMVGVDINAVIHHDHFAPMLQFVCGLGPRKAKSILDILRNEESYGKSSNQYIPYRKNLQEIYKKTLGDQDKPMMKKNIFINCCGFIKIFGKNSLDRTRIHYENYNLTQKICQDAHEEDDDDKMKKKNYDSNYHVNYIMKNPQILEELDFEQYALHLSQVKKKDNMIYLLNFIMEELTNPFADKRGTYKELSDEKLFYKLSKETPLSFRKFSIVSCKVERVKKDIIIVKIMENGLKGIIRGKDTEFYQHSQRDDKYQRDDQQAQLEKNFPSGEIIKCIVTKINALEKKDPKQNTQQEDDILTVQLSARKPGRKTWELALENILPKREKGKETFHVRPDEDYPQFLVNQVEKKQFQIRKINHSKYKQMSLSLALDYIRKQPNGDFVIRQSSQGPDFLSITWKFYEDCIVHLPVKIEQKVTGGAGSIAVPNYRLNGEDYECLDEIIERYINPINSLMEMVPEHHKFLKAPQAEIEEKLKEAKKKEPQIIHYHFGCFKHTCQHIVLLYSPKEESVIKEYIKIKPYGLFFHDQYFTALTALVQWFKSNYNTDSYRRHVRKHKNPFFDNPDRTVQSTPKLPHFNVKQELGIKQEKSEFKNEYNKMNKNCANCGKYGHTANMCTGQGRPDKQRDMAWGHNKGNQGSGMGNFQQGGNFNKNNTSQRERSRSRSRDNYNN